MSGNGGWCFPSEAQKKLNAVSYKFSATKPTTPAGKTTGSITFYGADGVVIARRVAVELISRAGNPYQRCRTENQTERRERLVAEDVKALVEKGPPIEKRIDPEIVEDFLTSVYGET